MAASDTTVKEGIVNYVVPISVLLASVWYFRRSLKYHIHQRLCAWVLNRFALKMNKGKQIKSEKQKLFQNMFVYKDKVRRDLKVLEVGSGAGANLDFFPPNTKLVTIDPNPHFLGYIKNNLQKNRTVISADFIEGVAENMPFEDNNFDIVVCTLVLCRVQDVEKAVEEIKRVLKRDGLLLFFEHVAADKKTWTWKLQRWLQPIWKVIGDNCDCRRETESYIRAANFSEISVESLYLKKFPIMVRPCILGTAKK